MDLTTEKLSIVLYLLLREIERNGKLMKTLTH